MFEAVRAPAVSRRPAVIWPNGALSWKGLLSRAEQAACVLCELGVTRLGFCLENDWQYLALTLACVRNRVTACLISPRLPAEGVRNAMEQAGIHHVVTRRTDLGASELEPDQFFVGSNASDSGSDHPSSWATVIFTTGSMGDPKAVVHRLESHLSSARMVTHHLALQPGNQWLHCLPLYHVSGLAVLFRCLAVGATIVFPDPKRSLLDALHSHAITHLSVVAFQLSQIVEEAGTRPPPAGIQAVMVGGGPTGMKLLDRAKAGGWPICTTYGLTEMSSTVTLSQPGKHLATAGQVLNGHELAIAPDGEILVRGPALFAGYLEAGILTRPLDDAGWFHTRDLGEQDEAGLLRIRGRKDNIFVSGGENISPEEIERHLCTIPNVLEAIVVGAPDEGYGALPVAFVRGTADFGEVEQVLRSTLPGYKIPRLRKWPRNAHGRGIKPDRRYFENLALDQINEPNRTL